LTAPNFVVPSTEMASLRSANPPRLAFTHPRIRPTRRLYSIARPRPAPLIVGSFALTQ
jgi:hypothetical protein